MSIMKADDGFATWVEQQMAMRGLDQAAMAERMGLTPAAVSRVLSGGRQPGVDFLHGVERAFVTLLNENRPMRWGGCC